MTPTETQALSHELVRKLCRGNEQAFAFWVMVCDAAMLIDHLADDDELDREAGVRAVKNLLIELPQNAFFIENRAALLPVMMNALSAWEWSNKDGAPKLKAFDIYTELPATIAFILGGQALVEQSIPELRWLHLRNLREDDAKDGGKK